MRVTGDARKTATISVDGSGFVRYEGPVVLTTPGVHIVAARAPDGSTSRQIITIADEVPPPPAPPAPALTSTSPLSPSNDDHPRVKGTAPQAASVALYAGSDCTGAVVGEGSAEAFEGSGIPVTVPHNATTTLRAVAVGPLGARSECSTSTLTYVHDDGRPQTTLTSGPGEFSDAAPSFAFTSSEPGTFECRLDGVASACTSPKAYSGLADGKHTFTVAATDRAGNADLSPATRTFTVRTPPAAGFWRFGEPVNSTTLTDASGKGNHGTYLGRPVLGVAGALTANPNTAATFDGIDDTAASPTPTRSTSARPSAPKDGSSAHRRPRPTSS